MLESLFDVFGAVLSGGATGLIGAGVSKYLELKKLRESHRHEEEKRRIDLETAKIESEGKLSVAKTEAEAAIAVANAQASASKVASDVSAMMASFEHDRATYTVKPGRTVRFLLGLVDFMRGATRPLETWFFTGLATYLTIVAVDIIGKMHDVDVVDQLAVDIVKQVFHSVLFVTTTCILWWFGTRPEDNTRRI